MVNALSSSWWRKFVSVRGRSLGGSFCLAAADFFFFVGVVGDDGVLFADRQVRVWTNRLGGLDRLSPSSFDVELARSPPDDEVDDTDFRIMRDHRSLRAMVVLLCIIPRISWMVGAQRRRALDTWNLGVSMAARGSN